MSDGQTFIICFFSFLTILVICMSICDIIKTFNSKNDCDCKCQACGKKYCLNLTDGECVDCRH